MVGNVRAFWQKYGFRWGDIAIIVLVIGLAIGSACLFWQSKTDVLSCQITQDGQVLYDIALDASSQQTITLSGDYDDYLVENTIQIDGESVYFAHATCPDQVCVHAGVLTRGGQIAVCLPSRIAVKLVGSDVENQVDAMA